MPTYARRRNAWWAFTMGDGADACHVYALEDAGGKRLWTAKVGETVCGVMSE